MSSKYLRKQLRRHRATFRRLLQPLRWSIGLFVVALVAYAGYMSENSQTINPASYQPLLQLIASAESNGNYNAYYGNVSNSEITFTNMTIQQVLDWQHAHVQQGNPSSAVGRYQIINTTLSSLVHTLNLSMDQKFDSVTQDRLAIALIERRGAKAYANREMSREEFAANLAKEWAALPKTIGDNPDASYYSGDGLNQSRVQVAELLGAIQPITTR
ncbi:MAG: hypothetical protein WBP12_02900 [Candidatus Saccharimonas sp.]